jgi:hypothetical protein
MAARYSLFGLPPNTPLERTGAPAVPLRRELVAAGRSARALDGFVNDSDKFRNLFIVAPLTRNVGRHPERQEYLTVAGALPFARAGRIVPPGAKAGIERHS